MRNKSGAQYAASKYIEFTVNKPMSLLDFIMDSMKGFSRNKAKDIDGTWYHGRQKICLPI